MKKLLAVILSTALLAGVLTALCGLPVYADENTYDAQVWKPVEITLTSASDYKNPYADVEINSVFTHSDGTTISLPGFWKENKTWAVRFSPTKTGEWTYNITCSKSDAGLTASGKVNATENTSNTMLAKHGFVRISDDAHFYSYADGTPFFWLGDTNWQAPNYISTTTCNYPGCKCGSQFEHEVNNRVEKGFTVYQTYFDSAESDGGGQRGILPSIWKTKHKLPSAQVFNEKIDHMFEYLLEHDMTVALGFGVHTSTMNNMKDADFFRFVRYCVARYACYSVVWISGQEITNTADAAATPGRDVMGIYMEGSELIGRLDGYHHPNGAHMYPMMLIDERAKRLDEADWHNCWILQAGHSRKVQNKKFYASYYLGATKTKPYIEGEANYEDINCGGFTGYDANRYCAWNALMCGCAGFTYGVTGIWANCYSTEKNTGWYGITSYSYEPWYIGLDKPGSYEVAYMRQFFESFDWTKLIPRFYDAAYADFAMDEKKLISSTDDASTIVCYFYNKDVETGKLMRLDSSKKYTAWWFNVQTGAFTKITDVSGSAEYSIPDKPSTADWAFLLTDSDMSKVRTASLYKDLYDENPDNTITGNIITPKKVTAIGGCEYINNKLADITGRLYDLSGDTAWEPVADRTTQTIIYDLGVPYDLTHITIAPQTGTTLPTYRIEVSNDAKTWMIMADASIREMKWSDDKTFISEKLAGGYRYVKVLILNAENVDKNSPFKLTYNDATKTYYSHTAIAEISVFGNGTAEITDAPPITDVPSNPGSTADPNISSGNSKNGNTTLIIMCAAVVGVAAGVAIGMIVTRKKKKD